ncbi:hypothetical protein AC1031_013477 [Aphanomyces cochlioides]|nr:hypothetical protein AC1031_013477 [Aphanomyces cochlioides]
MSCQQGITSNLLDVFHDAIRHGDVADVKSMLKTQPTLANKKSNNGENALMVAAVSSNAIEMLHVLFDHNASLDTCGGYGRGVLLFAAEHGATPQAWDCLIHEKEKMHAAMDRTEASTFLEEFIGIDLDDGGYGTLDDALRMSAFKLHWDLTKHLLAQYDKKLRRVRVLELLVEMIPNLDECFVLDFLRLPAVQGALHDSVSQGEPCERCHACVRKAVEGGSIQVVEELERFDIFRSLIFAYCHSASAADRPLWMDAMKRYRQDETWKNTWTAFWVQRRKIGLPRHMGWRIAQYLYAFDATKIVKKFWRPEAVDWSTCDCCCELVGDGQFFFGGEDY